MGGHAMLDLKHFFINSPVKFLKKPLYADQSSFLSACHISKVISWHLTNQNKFTVYSSTILVSGWLNMGISQRLPYTLFAVPSGCPIALPSISQRLLAKTEQFLIISNETVFLHF
jgi:hypothetical protein